MQRIHILRSVTKTNIAGTGSSVFAFRRADDAMMLARRLRECESSSKWYTCTGPNQYVLTTSPRYHVNQYTVHAFDVETVNNDEFVFEMMCSNLSVRIIDDISIDCGNLLTLNSRVEYKARYTTNEAIKYLSNKYPI